VIDLPMKRLRRKRLPRRFQPAPAREVPCRKLGAVLRWPDTAGRGATMHLDRAACGGHRVRGSSPRTAIHRTRVWPRLSTDRRTELSPCTRHTCAPA